MSVALFLASLRYMTSTKLPACSFALSNHMCIRHSRFRYTPCLLSLARHVAVPLSISRYLHKAIKVHLGVCNVYACVMYLHS